MFSHLNDLHRLFDRLYSDSGTTFRSRMRATNVRTVLPGVRRQPKLRPSAVHISIHPVPVGQSEMYSGFVSSSRSQWNKLSSAPTRLGSSSLVHTRTIACVG